MSTLEEANARILELEVELRKLRDVQLEANAKLRREGLDNGSSGVKAAFWLVAVIFIVSVVFEFYTGKPLQAAPSLIGLGAVLCVSLVAYFGFIFKYTLAAEVSKERFIMKTTGGKET